MTIIDADDDYIDQMQWENHSDDQDCCTKCGIIGAAECELVITGDCILKGGTKVAQGFPYNDISRPTPEDLKFAKFDMICMTAEGQREAKAMKKRIRQIIYG